jgi:hypothetical protein
VNTNVVFVSIYIILGEGIVTLQTCLIFFVVIKLVQIKYFDIMYLIDIYSWKNIVTVYEKEKRDKLSWIFFHLCKWKWTNYFQGWKPHFTSTFCTTCMESNHNPFSQIKLARFPQTVTINIAGPLIPGRFHYFANQTSSIGWVINKSKRYHVRWLSMNWQYQFYDI